MTARRDRAHSKERRHCLQHNRRWRAFDEAGFEAGSEELDEWMAACPDPAQPAG